MLDTLPDELLMMILDYLRDPKALCRLAPINRRFCALTAEGKPEFYTNYDVYDDVHTILLQFKITFGPPSQSRFGASVSAVE